MPLASLEEAEAPDSGARNSQVDAEHPELFGRRILLVEDEEDTRDFVALLLEKNGAEVTRSNDPMESLGVVTSWRPDLIISDIGMPGMDGYTFIRQVRGLEPEEGGRTLALATKNQGFIKICLEKTWKNYLPYAGFSGFMAYEVVTDLRHTKYLKNADDINTWANAGPGAVRGLNRISCVAGTFP